MLDPISLASRGDAPPDDPLYIDAAVDQTKERLGCSDGHAITVLLSAFHAGLVRVWKKKSSVPGDQERCAPARWDGADLDLDKFRSHGRGWIQFSGARYHPNRFLISRDDFSCWLNNQAPDQPVQSSDDSPTTNAVAAERTPKRKRKPGPKGEKQAGIVARMIADYEKRPDALDDEKQETLKNTYSASAETVSRARDLALEILRNSDK
jgi:hypothetical protein